MNEDDWLTGTDFAAHVRFVLDRLSPRRRRLLAVAFCRAGGLVNHPDLLAALDVLERYADGRASLDEVGRSRQACRSVAMRANERHIHYVDFGRDLDPSRGDDPIRGAVQGELAWAVANAASTPLSLDGGVGTWVLNAVTRATIGDASAFAPPPGAFHTALETQRIFLRGAVWEVAGNPFCPVQFAAEWRTDTVRALAQQMYESRDFSAMPILADALQDAGCDSDAILAHCRGDGTHVRGCWVLDLILEWE